MPPDAPNRGSPWRAPFSLLVARHPWLARAATVRPVWRAALDVSNDGGLELAGHLAFTALISLFPFLIFLAALTGHLIDSSVEQKFIDFLFRFTPPDVAQILAPVIRDVLSAQTSGLLTVSIIGTLWAASSAVEALRLTLNRAYGVPERRPLWWRLVQSLLFVLIGGATILILSISIIAGPLIWHGLAFLFPVLDDRPWIWTVARYGLAIVVLPATLMSLHRWLPDLEQRWRDMLPGVLTTTTLWLIMGGLFSIYLGSVPDLSLAYGSLGGVILTLLFLYASGIAFIFGAELNDELRRAREHRSRKAASALI